MQDEMVGSPLEDIQNAQREMSDFKNDLKQFGRDLASAAEEKIEPGEQKKDQSS